MNEPAIGAWVLVRPRAGLRVQRHHEMFGQFLPDGEWSPVAWSDWWHCRLGDGSIEWKPQEAVSSAPAPAAPLPALAKE